MTEKAIAGVLILLGNSWKIPEKEPANRNGLNILQKRFTAEGLIRRTGWFIPFMKIQGKLTFPHFGDITKNNNIKVMTGI